MPLKQINISGFKCISKLQKIQLAPITLLFGGNSAGKSTILQAFLYFYEVIFNENCNPVKSIRQGSGCFLNGFDNLIHKKDKKGKVEIEIFLDASEAILNSFLSESEELFIERAEAANRNNASFVLNEPSVKEASFKIVVEHGDGEGSGPFVSLCSSSINGQLFAEMTAEGNSKQRWLRFNEDFLSLIPDIYGDDSLVDLLSSGLGGRDYIPIADIDSPLPNYKTRLSIPVLHWSESAGVSDFSLASKMLGESVISQLFIGPLALIAEELMGLKHIGPVRTTPARGYAPNQCPEDYFSGLAEWDRFAFSDNDLKGVVNKAFGSDGFCSKYLFLTVGQYGSVNVLDQALNVLHEPVELGIGISQVFPVVVAIADKQQLFVSIEQPELHIHPGWQLNLADLFIDAIKRQPKRLFLIETHSEHLMLRLLSRIRMDEDDERFTVARKIAPEELSVICVYPDEEGNPFYQRQSILPNGDFELDWPIGFFEERFGEV